MIAPAMPSDIRVRAVPRSKITPLQALVTWLTLSGLGWAGVALIVCAVMS